MNSTSNPGQAGTTPDSQTHPTYLGCRTARNIGSGPVIGLRLRVHREEAAPTCITVWPVNSLLPCPSVLLHHIEAFSVSGLDPLSSPQPSWAPRVWPLGAMRCCRSMWRRRTLPSAESPVSFRQELLLDQSVYTYCLGLDLTRLLSPPKAESPTSHARTTVRPCQSLGLMAGIPTTMPMPPPFCACLCHYCQCRAGGTVTHLLGCRLCLPATLQRFPQASALELSIIAS